MNLRALISVSWPSGSSFAVALLGVSLALQSQAALIELQIPAAADNTIYQDNTGFSNGQGEYLFAGRIADGLRRRALLSFADFSDIPEGAAIASVELRLYLSRVNDTAGFLNLFLHRVEAAWGEGASNAGAPGGQGVPAGEGDATWTTRFFPDSLWSSPGGDYVAEPSSQSLVGDVGSYVWPSSPRMREDVDNWIARPESNHGWILLDSLTAPLAHARRFNARENKDTSTRPQLVIRYELPLFADGFE